MRQGPGSRQDVTVQNSAPADGANVGCDMGLFEGQIKVAKYMLWLQLTGGTSVEIDIWVRRISDGVWAEVVDGSFIGGIPSTMLTGRYVLEVTNLGVFDRVLIVTSSNVGGVTVTAQLEEVLENNFTRGD